MDRRAAREQLGLDPAGRYLLFPYNPDRAVKRVDIARELAGDDAQLLTLGNTPTSEVPLWINAANAVVCPGDWETFGLACVEALACDVPVLARPTGVHPEALRGIGGTLCADWDRDVWRAALSPHLGADDPRVAGRARALSIRPARSPRASPSPGAGWSGRVRPRLYTPPPWRRLSPRSAPLRHDRTDAAHLPPSLLRLLGPWCRRPRAPASGRSSPATLRAQGATPGARRPSRVSRCWLRAPRRPRSSATPSSASFRERGRLRRRLRFLRRARELAFRDVGGLMFDMRRFGRDRPDLVEAKLNALAAVDNELRALERVLDDKRPIHELREPGLSSCPRCGALHASEDNFCPHCGLQFGGAQAMGEVGGAIAAPPQAPPAPNLTGDVAGPARRRCRIVRATGRLQARPLRPASRRPRRRPPQNRSHPASDRRQEQRRTRPASRRPHRRRRQREPPRPPRHRAARPPSRRRSARTPTATGPPRTSRRRSRSRPRSCTRPTSREPPADERRCRS